MVTINSLRAVTSILRKVWNLYLFQGCYVYLYNSTDLKFSSRLLILSILKHGEDYNFFRAVCYVYQKNGDHNFFRTVTYTLEKIVEMLVS